MPPPDPSRDYELAPGQTFEEETVTNSLQPVTGTLYALPPETGARYLISGASDRAALLAHLDPIRRLDAAAVPSRPGERRFGASLRLGSLAPGFYAFVVAGTDRTGYQSIQVAPFALFGSGNDGAGWLAVTDRTTHRLRDDVRFDADPKLVTLRPGPLGSIRYVLHGGIALVTARASDGSTLEKPLLYASTGFDGSDTFLVSDRARYRAGDVVRVFGTSSTEAAAARPASGSAPSDAAALELELRAEGPLRYAVDPVSAAIDSNAAVVRAFRLSPNVPAGTYSLSTAADRGVAFDVGAAPGATAPPLVALTAREPIAVAGEPLHVTAHVTSPNGAPVAGAVVGFTDAGPKPRDRSGAFTIVMSSFSAGGPQSAPGGTAETDAHGDASFAFAVPTAELGRMERFTALAGADPGAFVDVPVGARDRAVLSTRAGFVHGDRGTSLRIVGREVGSDGRPAFAPVHVTFDGSGAGAAPLPSLDLTPGPGGIFAGDTTAPPSGVRFRVSGGDDILAEGVAFDSNSLFDPLSPGIACQTGTPDGTLSVRVEGLADGPGVAIVGSTAPDLVPIDVRDGGAAFSVAQDDAHPVRPLTVLSLGGMTWTPVSTLLVGPHRERMRVAASLAPGARSLIGAVTDGAGRPMPATVDVRAGVDDAVSHDEARRLSEYEMGRIGPQLFLGTGLTPSAGPVRDAVPLVPPLTERRFVAPLPSGAVASPPPPLTASPIPGIDSADDMTGSSTDGTFSFPIAAFFEPETLVVTAVSNGSIARVRFRRTAAGLAPVVETVPAFATACDGTTFP